MNVYVREYKKIERRTRRRDNFLFRYLPALLLLSAGVVIAKVYVQSVAIQWSREAMALRETARDLELQNEELVREIAALTTRDRVARSAEARLGMISPAGEAVVWLPVLDRAGATRSGGTSRPDEGRESAVRGLFEALWQEEALALTSR